MWGGGGGGGGGTAYVTRPGIFVIENFIMADIVQPSDKIKLILNSILKTNMYDKSQTKVPYGLVWYYLHR